MPLRPLLAFESLAQMERELLVERTRAGLDAAKAQGRVGGRKRAMTDSKLEAAKKLLESGTAPREVAANLGVSLPTSYRWIPASKRSKERSRASKDNRKWNLPARVLSAFWNNRKAYH